MGGISSAQISYVFPELGANVPYTVEFHQNQLEERFGKEMRKLISNKEMQDSCSPELFELMDETGGPIDEAITVRKAYNLFKGRFIVVRFRATPGHLVAPEYIQRISHFSHALFSYSPGNEAFRNIFVEFLRFILPDHEELKTSVSPTDQWTLCEADGISVEDEFSVIVCFFSHSGCSYYGMNVTFLDDEEKEHFKGRKLYNYPHLCMTQVTLTNSKPCRTFKVDAPFEANPIVIMSRANDWEVNLNFLLQECIRLSFEKRTAYIPSEVLSIIDFNLQSHSKFHEFHMFDPYWVETQREDYTELVKDPKGSQKMIIEMCEKYLDSCALMSVLDFCGLSLQDKTGFEMKEFGLSEETEDVGLRFVISGFVGYERAHCSIQIIMFLSGLCVVECYLEHGFQTLSLCIGHYHWKEGSVIIEEADLPFNYNIIFQLSLFWSAYSGLARRNVNYSCRKGNENSEILILGIWTRQLGIL
jgi:hypothetical protein